MTTLTTSSINGNILLGSVAGDGRVTFHSTTAYSNAHTGLNASAAIVYDTK